MLWQSLEEAFAPSLTLAARCSQTFGSMSGGEQQMLASLWRSAQVLLLDEHVGGQIAMEGEGSALLKDEPLSREIDHNLFTSIPLVES